MYERTMRVVLRKDAQRYGRIMNAYEIRYRSEIDVFARAVIIADTLGEAWERFTILYPTRIETVNFIQIIAHNVIT